MLPQRSTIHYMTTGEPRWGWNCHTKGRQKSGGQLKLSPWSYSIPTLDLDSLYMRQIPLFFKPVCSFLFFYIPNHPNCVYVKIKCDHLHPQLIVYASPQEVFINFLPSNLDFFPLFMDSPFLISVTQTHLGITRLENPHKVWKCC